MSVTELKKTENKENPAKSEPVNTAFAVDSKINAYGFIFLRKKWLAAAG